MLSNRRDTRFALSLIAPTMVVIAFMLGYPLVYSLLQSFHVATVFNPRWDFVGFDQYVRAFSNDLFVASLLRSLVFVAFSIAGSFGMGLLIALLLNRAIPGQKYFRALILLPFIVSEVSVGVIWQWLLAPEIGVMNHFVRLVGMNPIRWLSDPNWAMASVIIANVWRLTPFPVLILLAALQSIDRSFYEAAHIDGASAWQSFTTITLPLIKPMMLVSLVYLSFASFNQFGTIYSLTGGGPGEATEVLALYMYGTAFKSFNWGYGSALAIILFVINVLFSAGFSKVLETKED